jgi:hypothetical protein
MAVWRDSTIAHDFGLNAQTAKFSSLTSLNSEEFSLFEVYRHARAREQFYTDAARSSDLALFLASLSRDGNRLLASHHTTTTGPGHKEINVALFVGRQGARRELQRGETPECGMGTDSRGRVP